MASTQTTDNRPAATGVSAVIPAFNNADTIGEALESVAAQTRRVVEAIVVDDGSSDRTSEVARATMERCGLPGVVLRHENAGPAAARNRGVAAAKGEWIAFLDADDAWFPWRIDTQLAMAQRHPEVACWCGEAVRWQGSAGMPETSLDHPGIRSLPLAEFGWHNPVATSTVLVRSTTLAEAGGFDQRFRGPEDYDLWLRIAAVAPVASIETPLTCYRQNEGSLSLDERRFLPQVCAVIEKAYGCGGALHGQPGRRRALAYQYSAAAWSASRRNAFAASIRLCLRSLVLWPGSVESTGSGKDWLRVRLLFASVRAACGLPRTRM